MVLGRTGSSAERASTGILLAGGESRRMGAEKPLQKVGGTALIESVAAALAPCVDEVLIVTNRPDLYRFLGLRIVPDMQTGRGPLAGIQAGLRNVAGRVEPLPDDSEGGGTGTESRAPRGHDQRRSSSALSALVVAADYPFLQTSLLRRILRESPEKDVVLPRIEGRLHPLCARYASRTLVAVEDALQRGELSVLSLIERLDTTILDEEHLGGRQAAYAFFNVNTPEDLRRAEAMLAQAHPRE